MKKPDLSYLTSMSRKAEEDSYFIGNALVEYQSRHKMNRADLGNWLDCHESDFLRLTLCRLPDSDGKVFQSELLRISNFTNCNFDRLLLLVREISSFRALREDETEDPALLMAARDRKKVPAKRRKG